MRHVCLLSRCMLCRIAWIVPGNDKDLFVTVKIRHCIVLFGTTYLLSFRARAKSLSYFVLLLFSVVGNEQISWPFSEPRLSTGNYVRLFNICVIPNASAHKMHEEIRWVAYLAFAVPRFNQVCKKENKRCFR